MTAVTGRSWSRRPRLVTTTLLLLLVVVASVGCGGDDAGDDGDVRTGDDADTTGTTGTSVDRGSAVTVAEVGDLADGTSVTVRGHVFHPSEGATIMCDALGESFPPSCVGPQLVTNGLDVSSLPGLETSASEDLVAPATWTSRPVEVTGTLADGALQVDP